MEKIVRSVLEDIGLGAWPSFLKDRYFHLALLAGLLVWLALWFSILPVFVIDDDTIVKLILFTVVWYPVLEEILFRGIVQNYLFGRAWGNKRIAGLSAANWLTSLLFVLAHTWYQPVAWAIMILAPSLVYGFFRDHYSSIYPSIVLHSFYNAGFVAMNIIAFKLA